ncbi:MAG: hypothetical protein ACK46O_00815 [Flavobacteriia bacterium]|jgi:hypothetical protein
MKRKFIALALLAVVVASCGGPGKEEYDAAAQKICDCMAEKSKENAAAAAADTLGLNIDMTDLDFSLCALDAATDVDPFNDQMGKSIEEKCPDLKTVHDKYIEKSKIK